jgi:nicotinamidase-related amidase
VIPWVLTRVPNDAYAVDMSRQPALLVIDVQRGFLEPGWGPRDNPGCEDNIRRLLEAWRAAAAPVVLVRHDSVSPDSPLRPGQRGNEFMDGIDGAHDLLVVKSVNSAFYGEPNLDIWLRGQGIESIVISGITTNHCCETTARMAGNLGYDVTFVLDATHTFDRVGPDGATVPAHELSRATAANLHGEFATVRATDEVIAGLV